MNQAPISVRAIQARVCAAFGITHLEMLSRRKSHRLTIPRHVAIYLAAANTSLSLPAIGRAFCRDHTSVMYARDRISCLRASDGDLDATIRELESHLLVDCAAADALDDTVEVLADALRREIRRHAARDSVRTLWTLVDALSKLGVRDR